MSSSTAKSKYPVRVFEFASVTQLVTFLLTSQDDSAFRTGTILFEKSLNRLYVDSATKRFFIRIQADKKHVTRLASMAVGLAKIHEESHLPKSAKPISISDFMRRVSIVPATQDVTPRHWLIGLWQSTEEELVEVCSAMWDFGARQVDLGVAHISKKGAAPSHFVKVSGIADPALIHGWMYNRQETTELYSPYTDLQTSEKFYVLDGYRYPTSGLSRLVDIQADLCLLRPQGWLVYGSGQVDFFRRPHVAINLTADLKSRSIQEFAREDVEPVPVEIHLEDETHSGQKTLWQVDQEIDRQRRRLRDLETVRSRLVGRNQDEVFFAYRFNQDDSGNLNPLLIRMMRQNLAVLGNCDYAYCQPEVGTPYHLIVASRSQKQMGFSLQMADEIYYAPSDWRRWGVNLFLPLNKNLAPSIDSREAIPLLQKFLERSSAEFSDSDGMQEQDYQMWDAILWDQLPEQGISETRVKKLTPLLDQFRLLNSFQPNVARDVNQQTRQRLEETIRQRKETISDELDNVESELLNYVEERSETIRKSFESLDGQINKADNLVQQMSPKVETVAGELLKQPEDWFKFVSDVMKAHRQVTKEPLTGYKKLNDLRGKFSVQLLKTLIPRAHDLAEYCGVQQKHLDRLIDSLGTSQAHAAERITQTQELASRTSRVISEVRATLEKLSNRLKVIRQKQKKADALQVEIETVDKKEKEVNLRFTKLEQLHAAAEKKKSKLAEQDTELLKQEHTLAGKALELSTLEEDIKAKLNLAVSKLKQLDKSWTSYSTQKTEVEEALVNLEQQVTILSAHEKAVAIWADHYDEWVNSLEEQHETSREQLNSNT